jgi:predicted acetyltransferase
MTPRSLVSTLRLAWPSIDLLPAYKAALEQGWSPDNVRGMVAAREHLAMIAKDAAGFVTSLVDREASGAPIELPDGTKAPRLPGYHRWLWDGEFCGVIGFRWNPGTGELPPYCLGHIGYTIVPWKRKLGYATEALRQMLPEARAEGLPYVEITTDESNRWSRRVIETNGGVLIERFVKASSFGDIPGLRYRIAL